MICALLLLAASPGTVTLSVGSPSSPHLVPHPRRPGYKVLAIDTIQAVSVITVSATELEKLPTLNPMEFLVRPGFPTSPVRTTPTPIQLGGPQTEMDLAEVESIQVIRDVGGNTFGRDLTSSVLNLISKRDETFSPKDALYNPNEILREDAWKKCTITYRYQDMRADTKFYKVSTLDGHPEPTRTLIGSKDIYLGTYIVPSVEEEFLPDMGQFGGMSGNYWNLTGGIKFSDEHAARIGVPSLWLPRPKLDLKLGFDWRKPFVTSPGQYLQDSARTFGDDRVKDWIGRSGLGLNDIQKLMLGAAAGGTDMNKLSFPGYPDDLGSPSCGSDVSMPPGTIWYPDKPGYQAMGSLMPFDFQFGGPGSAISPLQFRTHCVNMALKEPAQGVRYYPYASPDPLWTSLANRAGQARFKGPWDQARTWIYTDRASRADMNKHVMLGVTTSQYVNGLYDVASIGGLSSKDYSNRGFFDLAQLGAYRAERTAFDWFATSAALNFGKETASYLRSRPEDLMKLLSPTASQEEREHLPRLFGSLLSNPNADARKGALEFLVGLKSGFEPLVDRLGSLRYSLYSTDDAEVRLALQASARFQPGSRSMLPLRYLAEHGPSSEIKAEALSLMR